MKDKNEKKSQKADKTEKVLYDNRIKRKNILALNEKVAAIREYEKMPVYKRIGRMFQCSPDQIKRIVQQKSLILKAWEQRTRKCQETKTFEINSVRVSTVEIAVYDWIRRMMYYKDFMITDGLLQKMALQFKKAMGLENFFPHKEWCDRFRTTYQISEKDSKLLKIGYNQGYSVQVMDVIKDVSNKCTNSIENKTQQQQNSTDSADEMEENEENNKKRNTRNHKRTAFEKRGDTMKSKIAATTTATTTNSTELPFLQPLKHVVALPVNQHQHHHHHHHHNVLVATTSATRDNPIASPVAMTIIPVATMLDVQNTAARIRKEEKSTTSITNVPLTPQLTTKIKKEEPSDYFSDDDYNMLMMTTTKPTTTNPATMSTLVTTAMPMSTSSAYPECCENDEKPTLISNDNYFINNCNGCNNDDCIGDSSGGGNGNGATAGIDIGGLYPRIHHINSTTKEQQNQRDNNNTNSHCNLEDETILHQSTSTLPSTSVKLQTYDDENSFLDNGTHSFSITTMPKIMNNNNNALLLGNNQNNNNSINNINNNNNNNNNNNDDDNKMKSNDDENSCDLEYSLPPIKTCLEARRYLKMVEDFALVRENFRLIGLVTRADEVLRELANEENRSLSNDYDDGDDDDDDDGDQDYYHDSNMDQDDNVNHVDRDHLDAVNHDDHVDDVKHNNHVGGLLDDVKHFDVHHNGDKHDHHDDHD